MNYKLFIDKLSDENLWSVPYNDYMLYVNDLLNSINLKILYYTNKAFGKKASISDITLSQIERSDFLINSRLSITENCNSFPLLILKKRFSLSMFQYHCLCVSLIYEAFPDYIKQISRNEKKYTVPIAMLAIKSFNGAVPNLFKLSTEFSSDFLKTFFVFDLYNVPIIYDTPLILHKHMKKYILNSPYNSENGSLSVYSQLSLCNDTTEDIIANNIPQELINIINATNSPTAINIYGKKNSGRLFTLKHAIKTLNKRLILLDVNSIAETGHTAIDNELYFLYGQAVIENAIICLLYTPPVKNKRRTNEKLYVSSLNKIYSFFEKHFPYFFIITEELYNFESYIYTDIHLINIQIPAIDSSTQLTVWSKLAESTAPDFDFYKLTNKFNFNIGEIKQAIQRAEFSAMMNNRAIADEDLYTGCHSFDYELESLGLTHISSKHSWEELILPEYEKNMLKHACNYIKYKHIVYDKWDYKTKLPYGNNLSILFKGLPGTGKTMGAQVIANELGICLFKLDLSKAVSKYIGETEENLNKIFDVAQKNNVILFIDEMDALFGKRSEVKDSHDKYANMQTSFLLQKIESYNGILILATNYLENIDEAFIRRIKFIIHFALPDYQERLSIWKNMFPAQAPISSEIDYEYLANEFKISGGVIKNIVLKAAFRAAATNDEIKMCHIIPAIHNELSKTGKIVDKSTFGPYAYLYNEDFFD